jgi:hypothetical protein
MTSTISAAPVTTSTSTAERSVAAIESSAETSCFSQPSLLYTHHRSDDIMSGTTNHSHSAQQQQQQQSSTTNGESASAAAPSAAATTATAPAETSAPNSPVVGESSQENISYSAERIIGNGSFGVVFEAKVVETNEVVAIKKVLQDKRFKNRELQIMRQLVKDPHTNIVALKHCFYSQVRFVVAVAVAVVGFLLSEYKKVEWCCSFLFFFIVGGS